MIDRLYIIKHFSDQLFSAKSDELKKRTQVKFLIDLEFFSHW